MNLSRLCASLERKILQDVQLSEIVSNEVRIPIQDDVIFVACARGDSVEQVFTGYHVHFGFASVADEDLGSMDIIIEAYNSAYISFTCSTRSMQPYIASYLLQNFHGEALVKGLVEKLLFVCRLSNAYQRGDTIHIQLSGTQQIVNVASEMISIFSSVMQLLTLQQKTA